MLENSKKTIKESTSFCELSRRLFALPAGVAQLVEQLICNQQVVGSSPVASSIYILFNTTQMIHIKGR